MAVDRLRESICVGEDDRIIWRLHVAFRYTPKYYNILKKGHSNIEGFIDSLRRMEENVSFTEYWGAEIKQTCATDETS